MGTLRIREVSVAAVIALALTGAMVAIVFIAVIDALNRGGLPTEMLVALVAAVTGAVNLILEFFFGRRSIKNDV